MSNFESVARATGVTVKEYDTVKGPRKYVELDFGDFRVVVYEDGDIETWGDTSVIKEEGISAELLLLFVGKFKDKLQIIEEW